MSSNFDSVRHYQIWELRVDLLDEYLRSPTIRSNPLISSGLSQFRFGVPNRWPPTKLQLALSQTSDPKIIPTLTKLNAEWTIQIFNFIVFYANCKLYKYGHSHLNPYTIGFIPDQTHKKEWSFMAVVRSSLNKVCGVLQSRTIIKRVPVKSR